MANPNISSSISLADKQTIKTKLFDIRTILNFLVVLTPQQRKTVFKMGPKSIGFVQHALQVAKNNPDILPAGFDVTEFEKDVTLAADLVEIESVSTPLAEGISHTLLAVGTEAMRQANQVYGLVKIAAKHNANMDELKKQLGERYKGQGARANNGGNQPAK